MNTLQNSGASGASGTGSEIIAIYQSHISNNRIGAEYTYNVGCAATCATCATGLRARLRARRTGETPPGACPMEAARPGNAGIVAELAGEVGKATFLARERLAKVGMQPSQDVSHSAPLPTGSDCREVPTRRRKWITPALVANFKAARPWLLEHLDALLAAGWTRGELFRVRRPLGHPYAWGVAWGSAWRKAERVELQANGWIAYHCRQADGRVILLESWPKGVRNEK